jgi:hypothetical protein
MKPFQPIRRRRGAALVVAAVFALLAAAAASAADNKSRTPAGKSADAILTPAQLRECLAQQGRKDKATDAALKTKAEIAAEKAAIDRSGTVLSEEATTLDRSSEDAVNAYNEKIDERNKRIEAYEAKVSAYNKDAEAVQAMSEAYAKSCGNRRYDDRDLADIQRKK